MEERDYIEELIEKNLEGLNDNEPPAGHFERFEARMEKIRTRRNTPVFTILWKAAAAAVFVFLVVNQAVIWFGSEESGSGAFETGSQMTLAAVSPEYEEVEFYFTNAIKVSMNQWEQMVSEGLVSDDQQQLMNSELEEFEQVFEKLQGDLALSSNDERVINAMLEYYQTKLSLITMIIEKLEEVKLKNTGKHETEI